MTTLRYDFCWDVSRIGAIAVKITETGTGATTYTVRFSSGTYSHTSGLSVTGPGSVSYLVFATELAAALNAASSQDYTVTWSALTGYTVTNITGGATFTMGFSTVTTPAEGARMRHILGMSGDRSPAAASFASQVRPYYTLRPVVSARSNVSDDYEPDGMIAKEQIADDGTPYATAVSTSPKLIDWQQVADQDAPTVAYTAFGSGTGVHKHSGATSAVPWTYEDAFEHHRTGFDPIVVVDSGTGENLVCRMRADKCAFHPKRWGGTDFDLWQLDFGVRLIARL